MVFSSSQTASHLYFSLCLLWMASSLSLPYVMTFGKVDMVSFITRKPPGNSMVSRVALFFLLLSLNSGPQQTVHLLGCIPLGYRGDMSVGVQGKSCAEMPQHTGHRFHIHPILQGKGSERVT